MRFAFIARHKAVWQIRQLCSALQVTRGGFYEWVHRRNYATRDEARADLFDYVDRFYNQRRLRSTIGYMSPAAYEASLGLR
jgi:transposase InsO family protein